MVNRGNFFSIHNADARAKIPVRVLGRESIDVFFKHIALPGVNPALSEEKVNLGSGSVPVSNMVQVLGVKVNHIASSYLAIG